MCQFIHRLCWIRLTESVLTLEQIGEVEDGNLVWIFIHYSLANCGS